VCKYFLSIKDN